MTVQRIREIYGEDMKDLTDDEVLEHIKRTRDFCNALLDIALTKNLTHYEKGTYDN